MSHWFFIINPTAGHRNGLRVWKSIQKELIKRKVEHRSFLTEHPGHAEVLARQISTIQEYKLKRLIVIGGDGTMHEVVNGLKDVDDIEPEPLCRRAHIMIFREDSLLKKSI